MRQDDLLHQIETELRKRDAQVKVLQELGSDWYWEQDADFRFTTISRNPDLRERFNETGNIGKTRWELPYLDTTEAQWAEHKAVLQAHQPFHNLILKRSYAADGSGYSSISGIPVFDADGKFTGYHGVGRDVTQIKLSEQRKEMVHVVTCLLIEAHDLEITIPKIIQSMCSTLEWEYGAFWSTDKHSGVLNQVYTWCRPGLDASAFIARARAIAPLSNTTRQTLPPGLLQRTLTDQQPTWIADVANDAGYRRARDAARQGWTSAFCFPVVARGETLGLMEFYSRARREPDESLMESLRTIGGQIGLFQQRKQSEACRSMEHAVTRLLAESRSVSEGMPKILQTICETQGWSYGGYWCLDTATQSVRCAATWHTPGLQIPEFLNHVTNKRYSVDDLKGKSPERSLMRRIWQADKPIWIAIGAAAASIRERIAAKENLNVAFAFPIIDGSEIIGTLEFFSSGIRQSDDMLIEAARSIGIQIGQFCRRKQIETRQTMEHNVTRLLAESDNVADAMPKILAAICQTLGWDYGGYWALDEQTREIRCTANWMVAPLKEGEFTDYVRHSVLNADFLLAKKKATGFMHRLWKTQGPVWLGGLDSGEMSSRAAIAVKSGLHSAFAFPILADQKVIGALEFFSHTIREPDEILMRTAHSIGTQIGQFCRRKQAEQRIHDLAYYDSLTRLPNRSLFDYRLNHALATASRNNTTVALLFIDLDRFKNVNDTLGHGAGDLLLIEIAKRFSACLRASDTVARLGGDEFVILLENVAGAAHVARVARKIIDATQDRFVLAHGDCHVTASVGISLFPDDGADGLTLMKHADIAMYLTKQQGKNDYRFYSKQINSNSFQRLALESHLRRAIERNEFALHYQPKVDLVSGCVSGMEALLRWTNSELGEVAPAQFIPLAEETGLIVAIGRWVMQQACRQNQAWQAQGLPALPVSVNLSARQFSDDHLREDVARALKDSGLAPEYLELEITESMVMFHPDKAVDLLCTFKSMGISIAIDDFGMGYSSLSQLKRFPIDTIKIDRSFISDAIESAQGGAIVLAMLAMGRALRMKVVAEGVETIEQLAFLRRNGCQEIQGYYFSRPIPADQFADLLRSHRTLDVSDVA